MPFRIPLTSFQTPFDNVLKLPVFGQPHVPYVFQPLAQEARIDPGPPGQLPLRDLQGSPPAADLGQYGGCSGIRTDQWFYSWQVYPSSSLL